MLLANASFIFFIPAGEQIRLVKLQDFGPAEYAFVRHATISSAEPGLAMATAGSLKCCGKSAPGTLPALACLYDVSLVSRKNGYMRVDPSLMDQRNLRLLSRESCEGWATVNLPEFLGHLRKAGEPGNEQHQFILSVSVEYRETDVMSVFETPIKPADNYNILRIDAGNEAYWMEDGMTGQFLVPRSELPALRKELKDGVNRS
jgi:hypothetical protein